LSDWLAKHDAGAARVCMEATGVYWEGVAEYLALKGLVVAVVNPAQIKAHGGSLLMRTKTDKADAQLIADYSHTYNPEPWLAPSLAELTLRALVLRIEALTNMRTQEVNRLEVAREAVKAGIAEHICWINAEIKKLDELIKSHIDDDPDLKNKRALLNSVPGLGPRTIPILLSYYADTDRFATVKKAVAFAGLDPRQHESGTSVKAKPRMSKIGHSYLRKALYMPAMTTLYRTTWGKRFQARLASAGKLPMVIIGAMMRKLVTITFGVLRSGKMFDPALHAA